MPVYEYQCRKCGLIEVFQPITADKLKNCPTCNFPVQSLISRTSFSLKGSGWTKSDAIANKANQIEKRLEVEEARDRKKGIITL